MRRVGNVSSDLELPASLSSIHPMFQMSMLKKFVGDPSLIAPVKNVVVLGSLSYEEVLVDILDRKVCRLRINDVASKKVLLRNQNVEEAA